MANENKRPDARRAAMERTKVRVIAAGRDRKNNKKEQDRLARQEQKMAEKLERDARRQAQKEQRQAAAKAAAKAPAAPARAPQTRHAPVDPVPAKEPKTAPRRRLTREDLQVIFGGRGRKIARWVGVAALVVAALFIINALVPISIPEYVETVFAGAGTGDGYPVAVSAGVRTMLPVGSDVALLGDSSLQLYRSDGRLLFDRQHGFANPAMCSCSARVLVYDRGGRGLRMENRARTLFSLEAPGAVTTADVADNGSFAVVTRAGDYVSDVTVYTPAGQQRYVWHSSSRQITAVSLSGNGRYAAVFALHVDGGQAVTDLLLFDTRRGTTLLEESYGGCLPVSLDVKGTTCVALFTDRLSSVTKAGERQDYMFEGNTLACFDNRSADGAVLVLERYQNARDHQLVVLDRNLNLLGQADVTVPVIAVAARGGWISLLSDETVQFYNRQGVLRQEATLANDGRALVCKGNRAIVLGSDVMTEITP